jgi:deoxyribodipyrimidine photo-lyase
MDEPQMAARFEPTRQAVQRCLQAVDPALYGRTRNFLSGRVTRLSPYLTHGLISLPQVMAILGQTYTLGPEDKLVFEFAWREYYQHVWEHLGESIFTDIRPPVWSGEYANQLPEDVARACTGLPVIDQAVAQLYRWGYLHNHARMWLASYLVHIRKVHWRVGADWMVSHLLDGDLASNHLSWQWVAGTFSTKPYLFNAENVAKYAPPPWHSPGSVIDTTYAQLEAIATSRGPQAPHRGVRLFEDDAIELPLTYQAAPESEYASFAVASLATLLEGRTGQVIELIHPWSVDLFEPPASNTIRVGWIHPDFHRQHQWTLQRWKFVLGAMRELKLPIWVGRPAQFNVAATSLRMTATLNPDYCDARPLVGQWRAVPRMLESPGQFCSSFTRFYKRVGSGSSGSRFNKAL